MNDDGYDHGICLHLANSFCNIILKLKKDNIDAIKKRMT